MKGELSPIGLRRILGILPIGGFAAQSEVVETEKPETDDLEPAPPTEDVDPEVPQADAERERAEQHRMRMATQRYFRKLTTELDGLQKQNGLVAIEQSALWINNAAKNIDQISTRNVDPELIQFSQAVSGKLRDVVYQFHQSEKDVRSHIGSVVPVWGTTEITALPYRRTNYGGSIRYDYAPLVSQQLNLGAARRERRFLHDEASVDADSVAQELFRQINVETDNIRQRLSQKYDYNF